MATRRRTPRLPPVRRKLPPRAPPKKRGSRWPKKPDLHISEILAWADEHAARTGYWPNDDSGEVRLAPWDTWGTVDSALRNGRRGCRPGNSLARLLLKHRAKPKWRGHLVKQRGKPKWKGYPRKRRMTVEEILGWADAYYKRTGSWPTVNTPGPVARRRDETWLAVERALNSGTRGLPGGGSLAQLLARCRGVRRCNLRPRLTIKQILTWADAFHARNGRWPNVGSGEVGDVPGENWRAIHTALAKGARGLRAGYTLATLLRKYRRHRGRRNLPPYTQSTILAWANAFFRRHGRWPAQQSGPIREARGETWAAVEAALSRGQRGMPGGDSLSRLLKRHARRLHGKKRPHHPPRHTPLAIKQILAWADAFQRRNGKWPNCLSGPIEGAHDETWTSVDTALRRGHRGLPGSSSVALLLEKHRGARHFRHRPRITNKHILAWADAHHRRTGRRPTATSGRIPESAGDTWTAVEMALVTGLRGQPGGDSLARFLRRYRGA